MKLTPSEYYLFALTGIYPLPLYSKPDNPPNAPGGSAPRSPEVYRFVHERAVRYAQRNKCDAFVPPACDPDRRSVRSSVPPFIPSDQGECVILCPSLPLALSNLHLTCS